MIKTDIMDNMQRDKFDIGLVVVFLVVLSLFAAYSIQIGIDRAPTEDNDITFNYLTVKVIQSPSCDCCENYKAYLAEKGFMVETTYTMDMASVREHHKVPESMKSCHTGIIDGYFVEGHVPVLAIGKLLEEKPNIDGIALPGMPSGSPGMPGQKNEAFLVYALSDGKSSEFMTIGE